MSAAHTPGPWMVSPRTPGIIIRDYTPISDEGELIASAHGYSNSGYFPSDEEGVANARLIAAAPELYASLKEMLEWCIWDTEYAARARAALAKAEGK